MNGWKKHFRLDLMALLVGSAILLGGCGGGGGGGGGNTDTSSASNLLFIAKGAGASIGSLGSIVVGANSVDVTPDRVTNLLGSVRVWSFTQNAKKRVVINEYDLSGSTKDTTSIYDLDSFAAPTAQFKSAVNNWDALPRGNDQLLMLAYEDGQTTLFDTTGQFVMSADLSSLAPGVNPRANRMIETQGQIFATLQRLPASWTPDRPAILTELDAATYGPKANRSVEIGGNPSDMEAYGGYLYVTCPNVLGVFSDDKLQRVNIATLQVEDFAGPALVGNDKDLYDMEFTSSGTLFFSANNFDPVSWKSSYTIYKLCVPCSGNAPTGEATKLRTYDGYVPTIVWDEAHKLLWVPCVGNGTGDSVIEALDENGNVRHTITETQMKGRPYFLTLVN